MEYTPITRIVLQHRKNKGLDTYQLLLSIIDTMFSNALIYDRPITQKSISMIYYAIRGLASRYYEKGIISIDQYEYIKLKNIAFFQYYR